jgi:Protein of unknown function (DUF2782)
MKATVTGKLIMKKLLYIIAMSIFLTSQTYAEDVIEEEFADAPLPPDLPDPLESGQPIEPEVTIVRRGDATIEEYRLNGRMYMAKITPKIGKPYYLVDKDGDGRMEARMSTIYDDFVVPQWVLFSW